MNLRRESFARADRLPFRRLDGQTVIVNPRRREVHVLNGMGSTIWDLLAESRNLVDLITALERDGRFDADFATIASDLRTFLDDLMQKDLVRAVASEPAP